MSQSYTIKTTNKYFYCIISPHQSQLGTNRAVETSRADIERIEGIGTAGTVFEKVFFWFRLFFHGLVLAEAVASSLHSCWLDGEDKVIVVLADEVRHEALLPAKMNTCHFGGEIKADSSTDIAWDGGASYQDNSIGKMHKVQERRCATPYSFENRDYYLILLTLTPERLQKPKMRRAQRRRCWRRSIPLKKEKPSSYVGAQDKGL